jgi:hypothetical protein
MALALVLLATACGGQTATETTVTSLPASTTSTSTTTTSTSTTTTSTSTTTTTVAATTTVVTTTTVAEPEPISAANPLRIWVIGDSLTGPIARGIRAEGAETGVVVTFSDSENGSGLVNPTRLNWPVFVVERVPEVEPDAVVVVLGANEWQRLYTAEGVMEPGSPEWEARYSYLVGQFMELLTYGHTRVYWVSVPIMEDERRSRLARNVNELLEAEAALHPAVTFVDIYDLLTDEDDEYAMELPTYSGDDMVQVRLEDGIHLTDAGGRRIAEVVFPYIAADWGL